MRRRLRQIRSVLVTVAILTSPLWIAHLRWRWMPKADIDVLIVDYTVPFEVYWEHYGLMWPLGHLDAPPPSGPGTTWDPVEDYVGYDPRDRDNPTRLSEVDLAPYELLYFADSYGVYEDDLRKLETDETARVPALTLSRLIFGGVDFLDAMALARHVEAGGDLIVEFNALPGPTDGAARDVLEATLGVRWTGWAGRVFDNFRDLASIPEWLPRLFDEQYPGEDLPEGPGLVMIHESGRLLVFGGESLGDIAPSLHVTSIGRDRFGNHRADAPFYTWFAVVEPELDTLVLGEIQLPPLIADDERRVASGLPASFPALTERMIHNSARWYMAYDGSNIDFDPGGFRTAGLWRVQAVVNRRKDLLSPRPAYWQFYVPMVLEMLRDSAQRRGALGR